MVAISAIAVTGIVAGYLIKKTTGVGEEVVDKTDEQITETRDTIVDLLHSVGKTITAGGFGVLFVVGIVLMIPVLLIILFALIVVNFMFRLNDVVYEKIEEL